MAKSDLELIDDYIDYYNEREFFDSLTLEEQVLYKCKIKDTFSFACFSLSVRWVEFVKSLKRQVK